MSMYPSQITRVICQQIAPEAYELQRRFEDVKFYAKEFGSASNAVETAKRYYQETREQLIDLLQKALDNLKDKENETLDFFN